MMKSHSYVRQSWRCSGVPAVYFPSLLARGSTAASSGPATLLG
ncbi:MULTISPECIES: hypothetical protein [Photorhabdus]|nr:MULTISPECIES: hypothetical protein [Photorhabdus]